MQQHHHLTMRHNAKQLIKMLGGMKHAVVHYHAVVVVVVALNTHYVTAVGISTFVIMIPSFVRDSVDFYRASLNYVALNSRFRVPFQSRMF